MYKEKAISFIYEIKEHFFYKVLLLKPCKRQRHSPPFYALNGYLLSFNTVKGAIYQLMAMQSGLSIKIKSLYFFVKME
jgi:hypothetical protein